jgi:regulator of protease activity HflC (stomatin/prohibitin superfamily)
MTRIYLLLLVAAVSFGAGMAAQKGIYARQEVRRLNDQKQEREAAAAREVQRLIAESEREARDRQLEDEANADISDPTCGLPAGRVRRLNLR